MSVVGKVNDLATRVGQEVKVVKTQVATHNHDTRYPQVVVSASAPASPAVGTIWVPA